MDSRPYTGQDRASVSDIAIALAIGVALGVFLVQVSTTSAIVGWGASLLIVTGMFLWIKQIQRRVPIRQSHHLPVAAGYAAVISTASALAAAQAHLTWWWTLALGPVAAAVASRKVRRSAHPAG
ncbi:hypothetical protein ACQP1G_02395 [Nocardia sp. CA-107356]|uniref:hypothetical protein n=1 Tax=Nocardia sp. CA-107356 TaxID=3239972 RepID=UPI003D922B30